MQISRRFTKKGGNPFEQFEYTKRASVLRNPDGKPIFDMQDIEVPKQWSQVATDILAQKYFRKAGVPQTDSVDPGNLRDPAHLDNGPQYVGLAGRKVVTPGQDLQPRAHIDFGAADKDRGVRSGVVEARPLGRCA